MTVRPKTQQPTGGVTSTCPNTKVNDRQTSLGFRMVSIMNILTVLIHYSKLPPQISNYPNSNGLAMVPFIGRNCTTTGNRRMQYPIARRVNQNKMPSMA